MMSNQPLMAPLNISNVYQWSWLAKFNWWPPFTTTVSKPASSNRRLGSEITKRFFVTLIFYRLFSGHHCQIFRRSCQPLSIKSSSGESLKNAIWISLFWISTREAITFNRPVTLLFYVSTFPNILDLQPPNAGSCEGCRRVYFSHISWPLTCELGKSILIFS